MNRVYRDAPALWAQDNRPEGFSWIDADDAASNILSFLRFDGEGNAIACVANFSGHPHESHLLGLPYGGRWHEVLNTDAHAYGGSGVGNLGAVTAEEVPHRGQSHSANVVVPPLGAVWLSHAR